jgi:autotransporter-associated beta strand protein
MSASGGGTLAVTGPWTNAGVVTVNNGTLSLTGSVSGSGPISLNVANVSLVSDPGGSKPSLDSVTVTGDTTITLSRPYKADATFHIAHLGLGGNRLTVTGGVGGGTLEVGDVGLSGTATLDLSQPVSVTGAIEQVTPGRGITKSGLAKLTVTGAGANTYSGVTRVDAGAVDLNKSDGVIAVPGDLSVQGGTVTLLAAGQIAPTSNVVVSNPGAVLDLGGHSQTYASLSISNSGRVLVRGSAGPVNSGSAVLRVNGPVVVSGGGVLNIGNNPLIVDYDPAGASPTAAVRAALTTGYSNGTWQGPGINATDIVGAGRGLGYAEAGDVLGATGGTFAGQPVDGSAVLVRYTLSGDANLDGIVDFNDLVRLAQSYNTTVPATGSGWYRGDFNYDGGVDFNDLVKLAQNYNSALPGSAIPGASERFDVDLAAAFASVPEPGLVGLFGLCLLTMGAQRRVRRRSLTRDR